MFSNFSEFFFDPCVKSALFSLQIFKNFPEIFLLLILNLIPFWSKYQFLSDLSHLKFTKVYFTIFLENVLCIPEKDIYSAVADGSVPYRCPLGQLDALFSYLY